MYVAKDKIKMKATAMKVIDSFNDANWEWHNGKPEHEITDTGIIIKATAGKDYWCRTFYDPLLLKTDAEVLLTQVP